MTTMISYLRNRMFNMAVAQGDSREIENLNDMVSRLPESVLGVWLTFNDAISVADRVNIATQIVSQTSDENVAVISGLNASQLDQAMSKNPQYVVMDLTNLNTASTWEHINEAVKRGANLVVLG